MSNLDLVVLCSPGYCCVDVAPGGWYLSAGVYQRSNDSWRRACVCVYAYILRLHSAYLFSRVPKAEQQCSIHGFCGRSNLVSHKDGWWTDLD